MLEQRFQRLAEYFHETETDDRIAEPERSRRRRELCEAWARLEAAGAPPARSRSDATPDWAAAFHPVGPPS